MKNKLIVSLALSASTIALGAQAQEAASGGKYIAGFGGISAIDDLSGSYYGYSAELEIDNGFVVGAAVGMSVSNFDVEAELSYRKADTGDVNFAGYSYTVDGEVNALSVLGNAWYKIDLSDKLTSYLGGGLGLATSEAEAFGYSDDSTDFAWQLGAGADFEMGNGFSLGVGYRYFNIPEVGDTEFEVKSNDIFVALKKRF